MINVSVIIPLFNNSSTIERAVRSVASQKYLHEIIIVDDCSTDDSKAVVLALEKTLNNIRVLENPINGGPAVARNFGAKSASGEFLCFLDADDEIIGNYFEEIIPLLAKDHKYNVVKVGMEFYDPIRGYVLPDFDPRYVPVIFSSPCNMIIRRNAFELMGGFSEDNVFRGCHGGEDVAFCKALAAHMGPLGRVDKVYYRCWSYEGSHLDKFLASTRLADNPDGFEFVQLDESRKSGGEVDIAISEYVNTVSARVAKKTIDE